MASWPVRVWERRASWSEEKKEKGGKSAVMHYSPVQYLFWLAGANDSALMDFKRAFKNSRLILAYASQPPPPDRSLQSIMESVSRFNTE